MSSVTPVKERIKPPCASLSAVARQVLATFPCLTSPTTPWTAVERVSHSTLALVTMVGLHRQSDRPYLTDPKEGDAAYRVIPSQTNARALVQSHVSMDVDHTAFSRDLTVTVPMNRVHACVQ